MKHFIITILSIVFICSPVLYAQDQAGVEVLVIKICTSVEDRQPLGEDTVFSSDVGKLFCYTRLTNPSDASAISHVWFYQDQQMAKVDLPVKAKTWRTWSSKNILPLWTGDWRVEVQDSSGSVLSDVSFIIE